MAYVKHGVIELNAVASQNIDALVRSVICTTDDIDDGWVFNLNTGKSTDRNKSEVWLATQPATGALSDLWMAMGLWTTETPTANGNYRGLTPDPRAYVNAQNTVFDAFKLKKFDLITMTEECLAGTYVEGTTKFVNATNGTYQLTWGSTQTADVTSLKLIKPAYISIGGGNLNDMGRVTAYQFEVVAE